MPFLHWLLVDLKFTAYVVELTSHYVNFVLSFTSVGHWLEGSRLSKLQIH